MELGKMYLEIQGSQALLVRLPAMVCSKNKPSAAK
jgi:hypothetical protein